MALLQEAGGASSPAYCGCLAFLDDHRFVANAPLMREVTDEMFHRPNVLSYRFLRHSQHETAGARIISRVAKSTASADLRRILLAHARDEFRHGGIFASFAAKMAQIAHCKPDPVESLDTAPHARAFDGDLANFIIATHVAELRNLALLANYEQVLQVTDPAVRTALAEGLGTVVADERRHVAYTSVLVNELVQKNRCRELFRAYVDVYDREGWNEIAVVAGQLAEGPRERRSA